MISYEDDIQYNCKGAEQNWVTTGTCFRKLNPQLALGLHPDKPAYIKKYY